MAAPALLDAAAVPVVARSAPRLAGWGTAVRPVAAVHWTLVLLVVGNLGRIPVIATDRKQAPLFFHEVAMLAALGLGAMACVQARSFRVDGAAVVAGLFALLGAGSAVVGAEQYGLSGFELLVSLAYLVRWAAYFGLYLVVLNAARDEDAEALWRTLERAVLAFAAFGVVQAIFLPGFAQMVYPEETGLNWDKQGHRLVSTLLDPNMAGALVLLPLLVILARRSYGVRVRPWRPLLLLAALLMTVSRSSVLALAVGGLVILVVRGLERRVLRLGGLALAVGLPFAPLLVRFAAGFNKFQVDDSAMQRAVSWLRALTVIAANPVIGVGFNTYGFVQRAFGWEGGAESFALDGGLLFIAVMTGLAGVALYLAMIGLVLRRCRRVWRDTALDGAARGTALGVAAGTAALVVHSVFVNSLLTAFLMGPLWVLWGIVFLHARRGRRLRAGAGRR